MTEQSKCLWCHAGGPELETVDCEGERALVHPTHREFLERFCRESAQAKWRFLGGIGLSILLGLVGQIILVTASRPFGIVMVGIAAAIAAVTLLKYPFATPETLALVGVARSVRLTRAIAYVILVIAVAIVGYGVVFAR